MLKRLLLALALSIPATASANDVTFTDQGGELIPVSNDQIRLMDENVTIEGWVGSNKSLIHEEHLDGWRITLTLRFKNESKEQQRVQMGFPLPKRRPFKPDYRDFLDLPVLSFPPKDREPNNWLIYDFETKVKGEPISARDVKLKSEIPVDMLAPSVDAKIFEVTFNPGEEIEVSHRYLLGVDGNPWGIHYARFWLSNGAQWKDRRIGHLHIEAQPNLRFIACNEDERFKDLKSSRPAGFTFEGSGRDRKVIWDFKDHAPTENLELCIIDPLAHYHLMAPFTNGYRDATFYTPEQLDAMPVKDLRILRNEIYAHYGYSFHSPDLIAHFSKQWWYQPNPKYDPRKLPQPDLLNIQAIKAAELRKKAPPKDDPGALK